MKSTPRNLMAGMNVSRDQKEGRVNQRAKGLPQDGEHAGGQTYDSSKRRETTSNRQTTSDHEPATTSSVPEFFSVVDAGAFHGLMGAEAQGCPGFSCAQQDESRLAVLGIVAYGIRLIDSPWALRGGRRHRSVSGA